MLSLKDPIYGEKLTLKSLKSFLKSNGLPCSQGTKDEKVKAINEAIQNGSIPDHIFTQWKNIDLLYEGNKHVYIFPHNGYEVEELDTDNLEAQGKEIYNYTVTDNKVVLILREDKYTAKYEETTGIRIDSAKISYFTIIEVLKDIVVIYLDPPTYLYSSEPPMRIIDNKENNLTSKKIIDEYKDIVKTIFKLDFNEENVAEYTDVLNYLWSSVNSTITKELMPYTDKILDATIAYTEHCLRELGLFNDEKVDCKKEEETNFKQELLDNFISSWQYCILEKNDEDFEFLNEYGKIVKEQFKTKTGSVVKVATKDRPIYEEKLHYNIKGTINDIQKYGCQVLKFSWNNPSVTPEDIVTVLEVNKDYFKVIFSKNYNKEEIGYVLSTIGEIKNRI